MRDSVSVLSGWKFGVGSKWWSGSLCWLLVIASLLLRCAFARADDAPPLDGLKPVSPKYMPEMVLTDEVKKWSLDRSIRYFRDPGGKLTLREVAGLPNEYLQSNPVGPLNVGYTDDWVWIKIPLRYQGAQETKELLLELELPLLDIATLYVVKKGEKIRKHPKGETLSYDMPYPERQVAYPNFVFPLTIERGERVDLYLRVHNSFSIHMPLSLHTPLGFAEAVSVIEFWYGMFFGALAIMIGYNFFVFWSVREKAYFYYVFYLCAYFVFVMTERVHGTQIWGDRPELFHKLHLAVYIWVSWIGAFSMGRHFLRARHYLPLMDRVLQLVIVIAAVSTVVSFFAEVSVTIQWAVFGTIVCTLIICAYGYQASMKDLPGARMYFLAWFMNFGGVTVYALLVTGNLPYNAITANSPQIGIVLQLILVSFALADRIKIAQSQAIAANAAAVRNLRRYRSLFNNAVEGIFQIGLNRRFVESNPAMARLLGYESPQALLESGIDAFEACYADDDDRRLVLRQLTAGMDVDIPAATYRDRQGGVHWAQSSLRVVYDSRGRPDHLEGSFIDVTEKVLQDQIEKERQQDRVQREVAEASAAAKSQFLANMSHEIRTPLTAIIGYGEALLDDTLGEQEKRQSAETVVRSGRHLLELINDILDHSKISANKLEVETLEVPLLEILSEVRAYFEPKASQKHLEFGVRYEYPLPEKIHTDPTRFKQILINLCGNALKFTDKGGIYLDVRCDLDKQMLFVKVKDTGIGLKPEQLGRLFDPFAQASPSIAREYGGTGLGLNISKHLAELLGGTIRVNSVYGQGSEFEVQISTGSLEGIRLLQNNSELDESRQAIKLAKTPRLKGRILYAEDNEVNRKLIDLLVSKTGAELTMVVNGAEALKAASENAYDLILMDIQMPVMNGRDATVAIRKSGNRTPIVALTANIMPEDVAEYKEAGCDDCLPKPVDKKRFYEVLARYLEVIPEEKTPTRKRPLTGRVLVAEDNSENQQLIKRYLKKFGLEAEVVDNGKEAVQKALSTGYDLILMDQHMPEMEGPEAIRLLRQAGYRRPVVAFTASDARSDLEQFEAAGSDGILRKPIDQQALYEVLEKFLQGSSLKVQEKESRDSAAEAVGVDDELEELRPIIDQFVAGLPERMEAMRNFARSGQWEEVRKIAHQLKGIGGSMGFPRLTDKAKVLDLLIKQGDEVHFEEKLQSVLDESQKIVDSY